MERITTQNPGDQADAGSLSGNGVLAQHVLQQLLLAGVKTIAVCPGARNAPLVQRLSLADPFHCFYWPEERSAAFFALGRAKGTRTPAAVITTSGTAAAELLPAAMEAYYSAIPLVLITADRPRRFRGRGCPQSAEQVGIFGIYTPFSVDLAGQERFDFSLWPQEAPAHLNICFEEPAKNV